MSRVRLSRALCAAVGDSLRGAHGALDALFQSAGAPGLPPNLSHATKWKEWLFRAGTDPDVDSLAVLGNVLEEFMDCDPPPGSEDILDREINRDRVRKALEQDGLRYFRGGRVLPTGQVPDDANLGVHPEHSLSKPDSVDELLLVLIKGIRRAMHPLIHRRKGSVVLSFANEYDVQDLLHSLLRPWVADIRPEEFTPSYAGTSTRMDFLLPAHETVIELKFIRDKSHAKRIGDELIVDIDHYRKHPACKVLWCVIYDPDHLLQNAEGFKKDLDGERTSKDGTIRVRVLVL